MKLRRASRFCPLVGSREYAFARDLFVLGAERGRGGRTTATPDLTAFLADSKCSPGPGTFRK